MIAPIEAARLAEIVRGGALDPEGTGGRVHLFDVRDTEAFLGGHVHGADHVPHAQALRWIPQQANTQAMVVLIDEDGATHGAARHLAAELVHKWFRRVRYLAGGLGAWRAAGLPLDQGGAAGPAAASHDGTLTEFQSSGTVPWKAVDPARAGRPI